MENLVVLVDEFDHPVGVEEKWLAHRKGLLHRAFSVFVYRKKETLCQVLLQQRHPDKYHTGGLWSNTCCSHPLPHEDVLLGAQRRLKEEMGLSTPLHEVGHFTYRADFENGLTEYEYDHVLIGQSGFEEEVEADPQEISAYEWVELNQLLENLETNPQHYTPWLKPALHIAKGHF